LRKILVGVRVGWPPISSPAAPNWARNGQSINVKLNIALGSGVRIRGLEKQALVSMNLDFGTTDRLGSIRCLQFISRGNGYSP
jgi:hypothetical protein